MDQKLIEILIQAKDDASATLARVGGSLDTLDEKQRNVINTAAKGAAIVTGLGAVAFAGLGAYGLYAAGGMQQTSVSMQNLIGNTQLANQVFGQLAVYANNTPFTFSEISKASQTLLGFGFEGQASVNMIKQMGDVAAASGGHIGDLALVTGQIFSQGKLRAQDLYQVINDGGAGVVKIMAQNVGGMAKLTDEFNKGGIPAKQYFDALNQATGKGGFAFEGAVKQSETFNGRISTLADAFTQLAMRVVGVKVTAQGLVIDPNGLFQKATTAALGLINALNGLPDWWAKNQNAIIIGAGAVAGALLGLAVVLVIVNAEAIALAITAALFAAPFILIGAAVGAAAIAIVTHWTQVRDFFAGVWKSTMDLFSSKWAPLLALIMPIVTVPLLIIANWGKIVGVFNNVKSSLGMIWDLLTGGDPTLAANHTSAAWIEFAKILSGIRDTVITVADTIHQAFDATINGISAGLHQFVTHFWQDIGFAIGFVLSLPVKVLGAFLYMTVTGLMMFGQWLGNMGTALFAWGAGVIKYLMNVNWLGVFMGIYNAIGKVMNDSWNSVVNTFTAIVNWVTHINWGGVAASIGNAFAGMWNSVANAALSVFHFITGINWGGILIGIGHGIGNAIIDLIQGALNGALSGIPGHPSIHLPHFASGVQNFGGGLAVVGEQGPELMNLPAGSSVHSNAQSQQMMGGGGDVHIHLHAENFLGTPGEFRGFASKVYQELMRIDRAHGTPSLPNIGVRPV